MSVRKCPGCDGSLRGAKFGPVSLEFCTECTSIWFDEGVLPRIVNAGPQVVHKLISMVRQFDPGRTTAASNLGPRFRTPTCPNCNVSLSAVMSASAKGVIVDTCPICHGAWLTAGRLEEAARHLFRGWTAPQATPASKPPLPAAAEPPTAIAPPSTDRISAGTAPSVRPPDKEVPPPWAAVSGSLPSPGPPSRARPIPLPGVARPATSPEPRPVTAVPSARRRAASATSQVECPGCSQPNSPGAPVCWACGKVLKGVVCGSCPHCEGHLHLLEWKDIEVRACEGCGGVWLADGLIEKLMHKPEELKRRILTQVKRVRTGKVRQINPAMLCKVCGTLMFRAPMMICPEPINTCPNCQGTFLEPPTFEAILGS